MTNPLPNLVWRIGAAHAASPDLADNFRRPDVFGAAEWVVGRAGQHWPLFHASEADPEGGYQHYAHTVVFTLSGPLAPAYRLRLHHLAIAPRLAHVALHVNDAAGQAFLRPRPAPQAAIRLQAGLHTSLYAEGTANVIVPAQYLRPGENRLTLVAHDGAPFFRTDSADKKGRLDRMATGAGFLYRALEFEALGGPQAPARLELVPSVLYQRDEAGTLRERCHLYVELGGAFAGGAWQLDLRDGPAHTSQPIALPPAAFGHLRAEFHLPEGSGAVEGRVTGVLAGRHFEHQQVVARRRRWRVFVTPHLHTDLGYTHRQWEVTERLSFNLDRALDLLETTSPEAFAYHLDAALTLDHYLAHRGAGRLAQLRRHVQAGRLGVPGNYAILLTGLAGLEDLIRNHVAADNFLRPLGLRAEFEAVVDVPSLSGSLPAVLAGCGIRWLVHASNQDRGPFRVNGALHRRSPYYWQGHAGTARVLVWLSKMYCELRKVCGSPPALPAAERGLQMWLDEFERPDYAPASVLLYGQEADNTDLDAQPAEFVRQWNAAYAYPQLVPSNVSTFFEHVEAEAGPSLPSVQGDGGAYWEDGAGSSLMATVEARRAQAGLPAAERLAALAALHHPGHAYPLAHFDEAWRQVLLYDEHTWGAFLSATDPAALLQQDQWSVKAHMAASASQWAQRLLHAAATRHSLSWNTAGREVVVYNPHSWTVSGPITVELGVGERALDPETRAPVSARRVSASATQVVVELWVSDLPGLSYRRYPLEPHPEGTPASVVSVPALPGTGAAPVVLENDHYRLTLDAYRGCATSLVDKALGRELVAAGPHGLGQYLYVTGGAGSTIERNQADLPPARLTVHDDFDLESCTVEADSLGRRARLAGRVALGSIALEWSLPAHAARVDLAVTLAKPSTTALEAGYLAFPLDLPGAAVESDSQLGWVNWHTGSLPGACKEWLPLQTGVVARIPEAAVWVGSPDVPLFTVGDIVRGRWPRELDLTGGRLFSYLFNNYWRTNYRAEQSLDLTVRYSLASRRAIAAADAYRWGWQARQPLYAQRLSLQEFRAPHAPYLAPGGGPLASVSPAQVALSTLTAARHAAGYIVRVQEISGADQVAVISFAGRAIARAWETDLLEYEQRPLPVEPGGALRLPVPGWGLATARIQLEDPP